MLYKMHKKCGAVGNIIQNRTRKERYECPEVYHETADGPHNL